MRPRPLCVRAINGSRNRVFFSDTVDLGSSTAMAAKAITIRRAVPKNGIRQYHPPSNAPSSGPKDRPRPRAASYRTMATDDPPEATPTITARAVATNNALPKPHPARNPTSAPTVGDSPESVANTMIRANPISNVFLPPMREDTTPVINMATPVIAK